MATYGVSDNEVRMNVVSVWLVVNQSWQVVIQIKVITKVNSTTKR